MSKHVERFVVRLPLAASRAACERAASGPGWRITARRATEIHCVEAAQAAFGFTNPATLIVALAESGSGAEIAITASNVGFGPFQSGHVRDQAQQLRSRIEAEISRPVQEPETTPAGSRGGVFVNGVRLREEQRRAIEQRYRVTLTDGRYWYDPVCGAWGLEGQPQAGVGAAGLALGGPLAANASNGNTGVFINGRELHAVDVQRLGALVGTVVPGRWWVDAQGNFGVEGWPMMGNLFLLARSRAGGEGRAPGEVITKSGAWLGSDGEGGLFYQGAPGSGIAAWTGG